MSVKGDEGRLMNGWDWEIVFLNPEVIRVPICTEVIVVVTWDFNRHTQRIFLCFYSVGRRTNRTRVGMVEKNACGGCRGLRSNRSAAVEV